MTQEVRSLAGSPVLAGGSACPTTTTTTTTATTTTTTTVIIVVITIIGMIVILLLLPRPLLLLLLLCSCRRMPETLLERHCLSRVCWATTPRNWAWQPKIGFWGGPKA